VDSRARGVEQGDPLGPAQRPGEMDIGDT
jgi:hypothetical protein